MLTPVFNIVGFLNRVRKYNPLGWLIPILSCLKSITAGGQTGPGFSRGLSWGLSWGLAVILGLGTIGLPLPALAITLPSPLLADVASEKISQFAQAYLQVIDLIDRRESELQQAETETESQQIQAAIQTEAFHLIGENQLTLSEYLQLLGLANRDPDFREQILVQIEEVESEE
ncbi:DUF4168 domain-containing protein [Romeria aff. gracilis LEGE 07310]|uniref:DUF4168 domain-containing protein n=1 Tax=Vasconcelosia minhoensis LEGE 07310 TaxID=915328 RepID=A0A8J7AFL4_9CYAN|nr:DUF4168 domain-containing protein [Romeria aff. gracilis LEGE 07310]